MIPKMSSHDFNNLIEDAQNKIEDISLSISEIKDNIQTKIKVTNYEVNYLSNRMEKLESLNYKTKGFILLSPDMVGQYSNFNNTVHAQFKRNPKNIFNVKPINSEEMFFKDEASVYINDVSNELYKNILKHDSIKDKKIYFDEFCFEQDKNGTNYLTDNGQIKIDIKLNIENSYNKSKFNIIEIDPYLMCSFDIEKIEIFSDSSEIPSLTISDLTKVSSSRIILDKKYNFYKVSFLITPKYKMLLGDTDVYPFGLKHIYFYEADFKDDSYIEVSYTSNDYIDYIEDDIKLYSSTGIYETTLTEQGIKIYLDKVNNILTTEQEPTRLVKKHFSRNVKTIYLRIPLGNSVDSITYNNAIYGIKMNIVDRLT